MKLPPLPTCNYGWDTFAKTEAIRTSRRANLAASLIRETPAGIIPSGLFDVAAIRAGSGSDRFL
jgi:hypothetical protein